MRPIGFFFGQIPAKISDENIRTLSPYVVGLHGHPRSDAWNSGSVSGLLARGGLELGMNWTGSRLKRVTIYSKMSGRTPLVSGNQTKTVSLKAGQRVALNW